MTSSSATPTNANSAWMSGKHGIGYRVPGGVCIQTLRYNVNAFAEQIKDLPISWVIFGLSSGAFGDRYLAPHSVLTNLTRGSTPKDFSADIAKWHQGQNLPLETYKDIDVFDKLLTAMDKIGVKVIAYMAAQGPAMLKAGEAKAFDYGEARVPTPFIDACALCPGLTGIPGNCACAPSVHWWKQWVLDNYGANDIATLKLAYAEVIVGEFAERYGSRIAGYWFDQGDDANIPAIASAIRAHNPNAALTFNIGTKIPLKNHNPGQEDYTYGHMTPVRNGKTPSDGCYNYGMVLSAESSLHGYVFSEVTPAGDYSTISNPRLRPTKYTYNPESGGGTASLAHMYMPANTAWNNGPLVWNVRQAQEWQTRVLEAGGAWTWAVARSGCGGCVDMHHQSLVDVDDFAFIKEVYKGLPNGSNAIQKPWQFDDTNCDCCSLKTSPASHQWGCKQPKDFGASVCPTA